MDEYSGKRVIDGMVCSRLTCSSRVNTSKGAQNGSSEKGKSLKPSIQSSSAGKEAVGSSSRTFSKTSSPGKPLIKPRKKIIISVRDRFI
ncbi:hypothetical protein ACSQ67_018824 [Phaseolus vulgaris]